MNTGFQNVLSEWDSLIRSSGLAELKRRLRPSVLETLDVDEMEALLDKLPQVGAIRFRERGALRIASAGWHFHIQGMDKECPYPVDFFVRVNGVLSSINLVLRLPQHCMRGKDFESLLQRAGSELDLFEALSELNKQDVKLDELELVQQKIYRPGVPNKFHWSTPGGIRQPNEDARRHGLQELAEEAQGLTVIASRVLLRNREYQGGNIPEFHTCTGVLCVGSPVVSEQAKQEGIQDYLFLPLDTAEQWFDDQCGRDLNDPDNLLPGGKTEHALLKLRLQCAREGIY